MFSDRRRQNESISREVSRSRVGDGDFTYNGVDGTFTLYSVNDFRNNNVKIYIGYNADDVPWGSRSSFESGVLSYLKKQLTEYNIVGCSFSRREF